MCGPRWLVERAGGFAAHEKVCPMVTVACQNAGCGAVLPRSQIGYHVAHECVHRKIRCMWCSKGWGIQVRERMGRHSPPPHLRTTSRTCLTTTTLRHSGVPSPLPAVHGAPHLRRLEVDHAGTPLRRLRRLVGRRLHRGVRVGEAPQGARGALPVHDGAVHEREGGVHRARPPLPAQRSPAVGVQARGCVVRALWSEDAAPAAEESPVAAARRAVPLRLRPPLQVRKGRGTMGTRLEHTAHASPRSSSSPRSSLYSASTPPPAGYSARCAPRTRRASSAAAASSPVRRGRRWRR